MNRSALRLTLIVIAAAIAGALLTLAVVRKPQAEPDRAPTAPQAQHVTIVAGEPTIEVDEKTQQTMGLTTAPVTEAHQTQQVQLFGTVVDVQELTAMQSQVATSRAQLQQADAKADFDRKELTRLRALNADNRAVSDKAVQEAAAALAADQSAAAAASVSLQASEAAATQRFGPQIASAMMSQAALYRDLVAFHQVLVQMTMPAGTRAPTSLAVSTPDGGTVTARLLSIAPRVDPRLQGASYFYLAPGGRLAAGMNVAARYSGGGTMNGVAIPPAALVSWQGAMWVYVRRDATHFSRRQVAGSFATNLAPGSEVVTTGAQQLLSEEMKSQLGEE